MRTEVRAFTTRLQENFLFDSSKGSSLLLRRCRWPMRRRSLCVCRAAGSACRLIPWFPRRREALGAVRLPIRRTESSAPTEGLSSFCRSSGGRGSAPPTKVLSDRWRSAGGGVRAPRPTKNLSRLGCQSYIKSARVSARPKDIRRSMSSVQSPGMQSITQLRSPLLSPSSARVVALPLLLSVSGAAV